MYILTDHEKQGLLQYKYRGNDFSLLYKYVLSPFAQYCVDLLPLWVAPNLITFVGLLFPLSATICTLLINPTLSFAHQPYWLSVYTGICVFVYQTMDNMDGKQARKTGSSSPFGMIFDHGCDAINAIVTPIATCGIFGTGINIKIWFPFMCALLPFYLQTWEEYYTGEMNLAILNGPSEGLIGLCICCIVSAVFGAEWWHTSIMSLDAFPSFAQHILEVCGLVTVISTQSEHVEALYGVTPYSLYCIMSLFLAVIVTYNSLSNVFSTISASVSHASATPKPTIGNAICTVLPIFVFLSCAFIILNCSILITNIPYIYVFVLAMGCSMVECLTRLMICHICDVEYKVHSRILWLILPLSVLSAYNSMEDHKDTVDTTLLDLELQYLYAYCIFAFAYTTVQLFMIVQDILNILNICLFSIQNNKRT